MPTFGDEVRRFRLDRNVKLPDRFTADTGAAFVGQVVSPTAAIAVGKFLLVNPVSFLGRESEGSPGVATVDTSTTVAVYLIGPGTPATGDRLVCRFIDYRWVAERRKPGGKGPPTHVLNGCPCTAIPDSLSVVVPVPDYSPFGYPTIRPDTLTFGPTPPDCPNAAIYPGYWGVSALQYQPAGQSFPLIFRNTFRCVGGQYFLSQWITKDSGGPIADSGFYNVFKWLIGFSGNSCSPFKLTNGVNVNDSTDKNNQRVQVFGGPS
jgi:hypothetical protein